MIFLFFGERGRSGRDLEEVNVKEGFGSGCTRWG
nr:MAG TPA: hypothetical protein [Caudoviricetes sp.]